MSTFIVAHQDDWQLCMADAAYDALMNANQSKVLFIYLTAGDAGNSDISSVRQFSQINSIGYNFQALAFVAPYC
jgi:hypothetical protein